MDLQCSVLRARFPTSSCSESDYFNSTVLYKLCLETVFNTTGSPLSSWYSGVLSSKIFRARVLGTLFAFWHIFYIRTLWGLHSVRNCNERWWRRNQPTRKTARYPWRWFEYRFLYLKWPKIFWISFLAIITFKINVLNLRRLCCSFFRPSIKENSSSSEK